MANPSQTTSNILISLGTVPVLAVLLGSKALAELMQQVGEASEELFRGDRLPVLHFHAESDDPTTESE
ncbi:hypothetical protein H6G89_26275 [Oscillatoria sp. FACHB-1407]|uniref:hypothetical protein n=1 Tax=Oscillatoria sp. FACHB-1407 TaxID=2692847 RepID=UPI0016851AC5|nr:hypothetical protein [Oscillatoria sp. FACHB-1407]MBD2464517.1 hypothetical protein [Oscillatoria sp. FACHB-1407]